MERFKAIRPGLISSEILYTRLDMLYEMMLDTWSVDKIRLEERQDSFDSGGSGKRLPNHFKIIL